MTESLLPGIELVNGNCAAVLPELPPAGLILISPPYDNLREYGGYNGAFDFDAVAAACVANLAPGGVLLNLLGSQPRAGGVIHRCRGWVSPVTNRVTKCVIFLW